MYERFTDRARKVMQLANQEAQRFNHEFIGTEHILLGLVKEGSGVAAFTLKNLGIDVRKVRLEVEKLVCSGDKEVQMGKLPQTPRAKQVVSFAIEEAQSLGHGYVGTEHLLLGLIREPEGVASTVLTNLGLSVQSIREATLAILSADEPKQAESEVARIERLAAADGDFRHHFDYLLERHKLTHGEAIAILSAASLSIAKHLNGTA
jgi:ATP-dependent Clp protease ATP-binding subunit ClpC